MVLIDLIELVMVPNKCLCLVYGIFVFWQNNTNFQTISLVNNVPKLFSKSTSQVSYTQVHCNKSSIKELEFYEKKCNFEYVKAFICWHS